MDSSEVMASTEPCWIATRQSAQVVVPRIFAVGKRWWNWAIEVVPRAAQTVDSPRILRSVKEVAFALVAAITRWSVSKYGSENVTSFARSQVMLIVLTTRSTVSFSSAVVRPAEEMMRYSTRLGSPSMPPAISRAIATSNPFISPVAVSR